VDLYFRSPSSYLSTIGTGNPQTESTVGANSVQPYIEIEITAEPGTNVGLTLNTVHILSSTTGTFHFSTPGVFLSNGETSFSVTNSSASQSFVMPATGNVIAFLIYSGMPLNPNKPGQSLASITVD
jgi:hypothetical protein